MIGATQSAGATLGSYVALFGIIALVILGLHSRGRNVIAESTRQDRRADATALQLWRNYCRENCGIEQIDTMTGREFERRLATLFQKMGYAVGETSASNDYGADLVLIYSGIKTVVQAKRWNSLVGVSAVQEIHAARSYYHATHAIVVTNNWYTNQAKELAARAGVDLWDRDRLVNVLQESNVNVLPPMPQPAGPRYCVPQRSSERFWFLVRQGVKR